MVDLTKILTPEFLDTYRRVNIPFPENEPLNWALVCKFFFAGEPDHNLNFYNAAFHAALKPISTVGVDNIPDLTQFLPPPDAPNFPAQALGLTMLFDQAPRQVLRGTNKRYVNDYFDHPARKLARTLFALPAEQRPDSIARLTAQGWSVDYAVSARIWLLAPLVHSEDLADQERQVEISEEWRREIEARGGEADPHRKTAEADTQDVVAFSRLFVQPPVRAGTTMQEYIFWVLRLFLVHIPIIRKFGRYPYRNDVVGRDTTEEEEQWAKDTQYFGFERDKEAVRKIREDVEAGVWSPLHDEPEFEK
ncbi:hypothetical protein DENSPDRAFT_844683 [Dentipellis sp. KUC8613]|nr:hypothetical protein DENSPDRAFT_844683 [Dentipellis sp. KUC8613]